VEGEEKGEREEGGARSNSSHEPPEDSIDRGSAKRYRSAMALYRERRYRVSPFASFPPSFAFLVVGGEGKRREEVRSSPCPTCSRIPPSLSFAFPPVLLSRDHDNLS